VVFLLSTDETIILPYLLQFSLEAELKLIPFNFSSSDYLEFSFLPPGILELSELSAHDDILLQIPVYVL
jgi:hypothetical protein